MLRSFFLRCALLGAMAFGFSPPASAAVQSITGVTISIIRVYAVTGSSGGTVYFTINTASNVCNTDVFMIDIGPTTTPNGRDQYAALLAAAAAGRTIDIDTAPSGCAGWGTPISSVYVHYQ